MLLYINKYSNSSKKDKYSRIFLLDPQCEDV